MGNHLTFDCIINHKKAFIHATIKNLAREQGLEY